MPTAAGQKTKKQEKRELIARIQPDLDRVTVYLRPARGANLAKRAFSAILGVIDTQPDDDARVAVIEHVLVSRDLAAYSGAPTPAEAYPEEPQGLPDSMHDEQDGVHAAIETDVLLVLDGDGPKDVETIARLALGFLQKFTEPRARFHAFIHVLSFSDAIEWQTPVNTIDREDGISREMIRTILWEERRAIATATHAFRKATSPGGSAEALLKVGASIADPTRRAIVLGYVLEHDLERRVKDAIEMQDVKRQLMERLSAMFGGGAPGQDGDGQPDDNGPGLLLPPGAR